jgi:hypothetical protein
MLRPGKPGLSGALKEKESPVETPGFLRHTASYRYTFCFFIRFWFTN